MLKNHLIKKFSEHLGFTPTLSQNLLFETFSEYISDQDSKKIFLIKGYAGTGKTSAISAIIKTLDSFKIKCEMLAPTGRAAKVFAGFMKKDAFTIHKKIYRQTSSKDGFGRFVLNFNKHKDTYFFVDEASMITNENSDFSIFGSGRLLSDLFDYVDQGTNCKLIFIGDTAQLPPVGLSTSPALDAEVLKSYLKQVIEVQLTDIVRQTLESGILSNATNIRKVISQEQIEGKLLNIGDFGDIKFINGTELIETLSSIYDKDGIESSIVICRSNKQTNNYNQGIRSKVLYYEEELVAGDYLMVVKNNYFWSEKYETEKNGLSFIANGDIFRLKRIKKYEELYGFRFADVTIELLDYNEIELDLKIMLNTLSSETASLSSDDNKKLFYTILEDYSDVKPKKKQYEQVKTNPYFNALQVKFSYAVTCHKAQGGQWKNVFIDHGFIKPESLNDIEFLRWLYTAFTRPQEKLYLVNFNPMFF
ncbi:MAG: ATP-dependent endonuclease [Bacteroidetes bacterium GWA2_31_9]|nr:MAG: ATP-dependent endonuclease [Bacteroidetes bacterium GWA2_31_9]